MQISHSLTLFCIKLVVISFFSNREGMTSIPHNLVLDSQPRFELTSSECLNLHNCLINKRIFMKLVAKCSESVTLSYQVHVKVCNPIPLNTGFSMAPGANMSCKILYVSFFHKKY